MKYLEWPLIVVLYQLLKIGSIPINRYFFQLGIEEAYEKFS